MKMFLFSTALVLVACSKVDASEALLFNSGGYTIEVLIGFLDDQVIAQVHFTPPGAKDWVSLRRELLRIEKFDMKKRILIMHFSNKSDPDLPASFSFSANKTRAVLSAATTGNPSINVSWGGATVFSYLVNAGTGYTEFTFNQTASNSLTVLSFFTGGKFYEFVPGRRQR